MGVYTVDEIQLAGMPNTMTIRAKAADMTEALKEKKTRTFSHPGKLSRGAKPTPFPLKNILLSLAKEHNLQLKLSPDFESHAYPYVMQTEESDLHLLTRLAKELDAIAKPASGFLLFVKKGKGKSVSGKALEPLVLTPSDVKSWRVTIAERGKYKSVQTRYHNPSQGLEKRVTAGSGEPTKIFSTIYSDQNEATQVAQSKLEAFQQGKSKLALELIGNPNLFPEMPLHLKNFRSGVDGLWRANSLSHSLNSSGFQTSLDAEVFA